MASSSRFLGLISGPNVKKCIYDSKEWLEHFNPTKSQKKLVVAVFYVGSAANDSDNLDLTDIVASNPEVQFILVECNKGKRVSMKYDVQMYPTVIFFREGKELEKIEGCTKTEKEDKKKEISDAIKKHGSTDA